MKKKEFIFIGGILILALAMWGGMSLINKGSHGSIRITVDGKEYGTYSLEKDQTIKINDTNVCEIKDGQARMISAQCPDFLYMKFFVIYENSLFKCCFVRFFGRLCAKPSGGLYAVFPLFMQFSKILPQDHFSAD